MPELNVEYTIDLDDLDDWAIHPTVLDELQQMERQVEDMEKVLIDALVQEMIDYDIKHGVTTPVQLPMNYVMIVDDEQW